MKLDFAMHDIRWRDPAGSGAAGGPPHGRRRLGMTFTEVMFAVVLLGIGFLMLAGMFPVAIQQTQATVGDTVGTQLAQAAARAMAEMSSERLYRWSEYQREGTSTSYPLTYAVRPFETVQTKYSDGIIDPWEQISGNFISATDPRFAWVPLFMRRKGDNFARLFIICVESRNRSAFTEQDVRPNQRNIINLYPRVLNGVTFHNADPDFIEFPGNPATDPSVAAVAEGAFLITAEGRIYRVASQGDVVSGKNRWYLAPGYDLRQDDPDHERETTVYLIGRGYVDGASIPTGPAMDIACYSTFIMLK